MRAHTFGSARAALTGLVPASVVGLRPGGEETLPSGVSPPAAGTVDAQLGVRT
jgi:hypothetical protein